MKTLLACVAFALCPAVAGAQTLLDDYARVNALVTYMTGYVAETLLACAAARVHTDAQAEARFSAYRERNAALLERTEAWQKSAEERLRAEGEEASARQLSEQAGMVATAAASQRVQAAIGGSANVPAQCAAWIGAIESGRFDISGNAELQQLLAK